MGIVVPRTEDAARGAIAIAALPGVTVNLEPLATRNA